MAGSVERHGEWSTISREMGSQKRNTEGAAVSPETRRNDRKGKEQEHRADGVLERPNFGAKAPVAYGKGAWVGRMIRKERDVALMRCAVIGERGTVRKSRMHDDGVIRIRQEI